MLGIFTCGLWFELCPFKSPNPPGLEKVALFGDRFVADVVSSDEVILEWGGLLIQQDWHPCKKGGVGTQMPVHTGIADVQRKADWGDDFSIPRMPRITSKSPGAQGEAWDRFSVTAPRGNQPCERFDPRCPASRMMRQ